MRQNDIHTTETEAEQPIDTVLEITRTYTKVYFCFKTRFIRNKLGSFDSVQSIMELVLFRPFQTNFSLFLVIY